MLLACFAVTCIILTRIPKMTQAQSYHNFADTRTVVGIPNFADVASNLGFFLSGLLTVYVASQTDLDSKLIFAFGVSQMLLCFASAYYHWRPCDFGLAVDRLGMSLVFALALILWLSDRDCSIVMNAQLVTLLVAICVGGCLAWMLSNSKGDGDLRPYGLSQYFPLATLLVFMLFYKSKYKAQDWIAWVAIAMIALSKVPEIQDAHLFEKSGEFMSGHTLKHYVAAFGLACFAAYLLNRSTATAAILLPKV